MHVNFGIVPPLDPPVRGKRDRYAAYARAGAARRSSAWVALAAGPRRSPAARERGREASDRELGRDALVDRFLTHLAAERGRSPATVRAYASDLAAYLALGASAPALDPVTLTHRELRLYLAELAGARYAPRTDRAAPLVAAQLLRLPRRRGTRARQPGRGARHAEAAVRGCPSSCPADLLAALLDAPGRRHARRACATRAVLELLYAAGLRVGEVESLDLGGLDLAQGQVRVMGKGEQGADRPDPPHGARRSCGVARQGRPALAKPSKPTDAVFLNRLGHALLRRFDPPDDGSATWPASAARPGSRRTRCGTRSPRTCSKAGPT